MAISAAMREQFVAYEQFVEPALQYLAGQGAFRPRSEEWALLGLQQAAQYALKRLLVVAVVERSANEIVLELPAIGRDETTTLTDIPRYALLEGPEIAQVKYGERIYLPQPELSLRQHRIKLDREGRGLAPLFGDLLPFDLDFN